MRGLVITILAALLLGVAHQSASAACAPWIRWMNNQTVDNVMTVRSGRSCTLNFRSAGPTQSTVILSRPKHGTLSMGGVGAITYRSRPGFVGDDSFTYARRGFDALKQPMNATIRIAVRVTP